MQIFKHHGFVTLTAVMFLLFALSERSFAAKNGLVLSGTAYNAATKAPFEGAIVLGIYKRCGGNLAVSACWCVRTSAVRTGKDGVFEFPVTAAEGYPELTIFAPNHYLKDFELPPSKSRHWWDKKFYAGWDLWLAPQDPDYPDFRYARGEALSCRRASSKEDARAGMEFEATTNAEHARLLRIVVDKAHRSIQTAEQKRAIVNMEQTIDVLELGPQGAQAKAHEAFKLRTVSVSRVIGAKAEDFSCCFEFADPSRATLFAGMVEKDQIMLKFKKESICVRASDADRANALQLDIP